jgi:hypothetical protein
MLHRIVFCEEVVYVIVSISKYHVKFLLGNMNANVRR